MSVLAELAESYAFESSPSFLDLGDYHLPFEDLVGGGPVESRLLTAVMRRERVAHVSAALVD